MAKLSASVAPEVQTISLGRSQLNLLHEIVPPQQTPQLSNQIYESVMQDFQNYHLKLNDQIFFATLGSTGVVEHSPYI